MKKFLPFLFPLIAVVIVLFLAFRWYNSQVGHKDGKISDFAEGIQIEDLSQAEVNKLRQPVKDTSSVDMQGSDQASGQIRYEEQTGKVNFSVTANLPELSSGVYQVWLKEVNGEARRKAFILELSKGGYIGSAAISAETLPFEVVVTQQQSAQDSQMGLPILRGVIPKIAPASQVQK